MTIYSLNVSSPWCVHLHWGAYWRWLPTRWSTGFQKELWWLCFRIERHVIGATAHDRVVVPEGTPGAIREAVQGATLYHEWAIYTRRADLDCLFRSEEGRPKWFLSHGRWWVWLLQAGCIGGLIGVGLAWRWHVRPVAWWEAPAFLFGIACNFCSLWLLGAWPFRALHGKSACTK